MPPRIDRRPPDVAYLEAMSVARRVALTSVELQRLRARAEWAYRQRTGHAVPACLRRREGERHAPR